MMRLLQSHWTAVCVGTAAYLATMVAVWRPHAVPPVQAVSESAPRESAVSWAFQNPEMDLLMNELKREKESLAAKEKDLNELAARLQTERAELSQLTQTVQQAQAEFDQNVTHVRTEETANLKRLAKMYSTMSPEGAASVFKALDEAAVVKILTCMKDSETAPILEVMAKQGDAEAKRVASISERLRLAFAESKKTP
jgi:flagellar motility protein MotE (MotC chaperone)